MAEQQKFGYVWTLQRKVLELAPTCVCIHRHSYAHLFFDALILSYCSVSSKDSNTEPYLRSEERSVKSFSHTGEKKSSCPQPCRAFLSTRLHLLAGEVPHIQLNHNFFPYGDRAALYNCKFGVKEEEMQEGKCRIH